MLDKIIGIIFAILFSVFLSIALLDWLGGCGESFTYANGSQHQGECLGRDLIHSLIFRSK